MPQPYAGPPIGPASTPIPSRVLVVADDPTVGDVIGRYLERAGLAVSVAADGPQALAAFDPDRPDVVVLDVTLPAPALLHAPPPPTVRAHPSTPVPTSFPPSTSIKDVFTRSEIRPCE
ncbi:response regulator [Micromonospora sp. NPDC049679]|uniref:response regulator transcription factor n=1 Tax=Micromonospora sp. NPDC049679 TaxID=3155920 RepID=UPI0033EB1F33